MAESKKPVVALNDQERFPLIKNLSFLMQMRQDELAPLYNFQSGDRLTSEHLEKVNQYAQNIRGNRKFWDEHTIPEWIEEYCSWCHHTVPFFRRRKGKFADQPTMTRSDISAVPWQFVSEASKLDELLVYQTSGTTGAAMDVLFDPVSQACWLPQLESILDRLGIGLDKAPDLVSIALICSQSSTLTYASLSTYMQGAGVLKINLNPDDWKEPVHRIKYLEKYNPQILTGDPFAFLDLLELKPRLSPRALVSSAMKLTEGVRKKLEDYFGCPVLDVYSLTECRMVAVAENGRHRAIRPELYLEIFDPETDEVLPPGARGELVISGGNNPFLPLIRYRTGDFCKLHVENGIPYLVDLEARNPVAFYTRSGRMINNIEISRAMTEYPLAGFTLHQAADYKLYFTGWSEERIEGDVLRALKTIFGEDIEIDLLIQPVNTAGVSKSVTYTSDL